MELDAQSRAVLDYIAQGETVALHTLSPEEARRNDLLPLAPGPSIRRVEDRTIPGPAGALPIRVYTPGDQAMAPVLVWFHGGGWVLGDLDMDDATCRRLAVGSGCIVVSVGYRLAPEAKFPAPVEDCYAAIAWIAEHGEEVGADPTRIAVGGDSAGGNLAAAVALMARDRGRPSLAFQLLVCPITDHRFDTASYIWCANDYRPKRDLIAWFWDHYLEEPQDGAHPYASPLRAESLQGVPPAHVITAEYDPLRDEGEAYAARLLEAGVPTTSKRYEGSIHFLFLLADRLDAGMAAISDACQILKRALANSPSMGAPAG